MTRRPSVPYIASLVALLVLVALALGPGRSLMPQGGASGEQPENQANASFQLDDLTAPPSDRAIDWGMFRVIPGHLWVQETAALERSGVRVVGTPSVVTKISTMDEAKTVLPVVYQPTFIPPGFDPLEVEGRKTNAGSYPIKVDGRDLVTTAIALTVTYRHSDGRQFTLSQDVLSVPVPVNSPVNHPRVEVRLGKVQGQPAVFDMNTANVLNGDASIEWGIGGVRITVLGKRADLATLLLVAESMNAGG